MVNTFEHNVYWQKGFCEEISELFHLRLISKSVGINVTVHKKIYNSQGLTPSNRGHEPNLKTRRGIVFQ